MREYAPTLAKMLHLRKGEGGRLGAVRRNVRLYILLDGRHVKRYFPSVEIESIHHKALRRYVETGKAKGLPGDLVDRLFKMLTFIIDAETLDELNTPPNYGLHRLTGDRAGTWAMTVTRNWRMTFALDDQGAIIDLDLEDYH